MALNSAECQAMLISDEYMTDEAHESRATIGKTPMLRRQNSQAASRCLPPIREFSLSIERHKDHVQAGTNKPKVMKAGIYGK